jgi:hypothetical protein
MSIEISYNCFNSPKVYKVVNHPTKPYVRKYNRTVDGSMTMYEAHWRAAYANKPFEISNLFKDD